MANMQMTKTPMPEQDANVRNHNFKEVTLGYTAEMAVNEAKRCLQCKKPQCIEGCPVNIRIPEFIAKVAEGDFAAAYEIITSTNALPALSGRVCPQETQCESKCVRGVKGEPVAIGRLERFVADWHNAHAAEAENQRAQQADAALEVEAEVRVIPPAGVEQLLHDPRGCVFEYRGAHHRNQEDDDRVMYVAENGDAEYRAGAVDRAQRAVEEPSVDQAVLLAGDENGLVHPADETVEQKPEEIMFECDDHRRASISA